VNEVLLINLKYIFKMEYSKPQKEKYYNQTGGYTKGGYNTGYKKVNILNK
jgi:hypothetical protein